MTSATGGGVMPADDVGRARRGNATNRAVGLSHVEEARVGQARHEQVGDALQTRLEVERGGQDLARLGQVGEATLGGLGLHARRLLADQLQALGFGAAAQDRGAKGACAPS